MNNQFYEIPNDWYNEFNKTFMNGISNMPNMMNNNMPNMVNNNMINMNNNLANPKDGFLRGNMFDNLYDPYKNYKYRDLRPNSKREELLYNILKHNFVLIELQLYLDVNPMDSNMISLYNKYLMAKKKLVDEYEKNYGPLTMDGMNMGDNKWNWNNSPWPWEVVR